MQKISKKSKVAKVLTLKDLKRMTGGKAAADCSNSPEVVSKSKGQVR